MDKNEDILIDGIEERIEAFLRGKMTAEEEVAFKHEIRQNPELHNRTMAMVKLIKGLQKQNSAREASILKYNTAKSRVRPILWWACSIAAVFAIFFGIYKDQRCRMLDATVSPYYMEYDKSDVSRGDVDSAMVAHLFDLFSQIQENRDVSSIIKELDPIYKSLDEDFTYNAYANDIAWNLAIAYVKDNQINKAVVILQKLKDDNPDTLIYNRASELIKRLQEL